MQILLDKNAQATYNYRIGYMNMREINKSIASNAGKWIDVLTDRLFKNSYMIETQYGNATISDTYVRAVRDDVRNGKCVCPLCGRIMDHEGDRCTECGCSFATRISPENCFRLLYPNDSKALTFGFCNRFLLSKTILINVENCCISICCKNRWNVLKIKVYDKKLYRCRHDEITGEELTVSVIKDMYGEKRGTRIWDFIQNIINVSASANALSGEMEEFECVV